MAKKKTSTSIPAEGITPRGFFRIKICDADGKVAGDSGWKQNIITNDGFSQYLCQSLGGIAGAKSVSHVILGIGRAPAVTDTSLDGEITDVAGMRCAVVPTIISSRTIQFAFTLASSLITSPKTLQNIGLINHSSTSQAGTIFAGNTYATSTLATNQQVQGSYQIRMS